MKRIIFFILFLSLIITNTVFGVNLLSVSATELIYHKDITIYWATTEDTITVSWDKDVGVDGFEIEMRWIRGDKVLQVYPTLYTTQNSLDIQIPRAGVFIVAVRAYSLTTSQGVKIYSGWAESNNSEYATVDGEHKAWIIICSLAGTGPITIE
jgi:hypothetical protein